MGTSSRERTLREHILKCNWYLDIDVGSWIINAFRQSELIDAVVNKSERPKFEDVNTNTPTSTPRDSANLNSSTSTLTSGTICPRLKQLIEECWDADPERRPSFGDMLTENVRNPVHSTNWSSYLLPVGIWWHYCWNPVLESKCIRQRLMETKILWKGSWLTSKSLWTHTTAVPAVFRTMAGVYSFVLFLPTYPNQSGANWRHQDTMSTQFTWYIFSSVV